MYCLSSFRTNKHYELPAFHLRFLNDDTVFSERICYFIQRIKSYGLRINYFSAAKPHGHLDFVFFFKEFLDFSNLEIEIVFFGFWTKFDLSSLDNRLFLLGLLLLFFQFVPEFIIIHYPADRRISFVGNLYQIKSLFPGGFEGISGVDYSALLTIRIDETNLSVVDGFVNFYLQFLLWGKFFVASFFNVRSSCLVVDQATLGLLSALTRSQNASGVIAGRFCPSFFLTVMVPSSFSRWPTISI